MSSSVFVVDTTMRRTQVKVAPGKYLREVLEEACKARKLNPESYTLKTQSNKAVDLSQPFRLSGLSPGAKLQLTQASRSTGVVNVALQLPESEGGQRLSDKFPSTTSLWIVLRKFEDAVAGQQSRKLNLTQRATPSNNSSGSGRLEYESPVLNAMGRSLESFADLQKTLSQLGFNSGSVLIRLTFKSSGQPLEEAMKEIESHFSTVDTIPGSATTSEPKGAHAAPNGILSSAPNASAENAAVPAEGDNGPDPPEPDDRDSPMAGAEAPVAQPVDNDALATSSQGAPQPTEPMSNVVNGIVVFRPPSSSTPAAARQDDDPAVFEPSIDDAKAHQAALQRASRNTRLPSDKELEEQQQARRAKLALVQSVTVRVRYPDQSIIETTVYANETSADLYGKVMGTLAYAPEPFELRYIGDKGHKTLPNSTSQQLVRDLSFRGKVLVTLVWSPEASNEAKLKPSLKEEYRSKAQELKVDLQTQHAAGVESHRAAMAKKDPPGPSYESKGKGDLESKMKKFLGFGKK